MNLGYSAVSFYNDWGLACFLGANIDGKLCGKADDDQGNRKNNTWKLCHINKNCSK